MRSEMYRLQESNTNHDVLANCHVFIDVVAMFSWGSVDPKYQKCLCLVNETSVQAYLHTDTM